MERVPHKHLLEQMEADELGPVSGQDSLCSSEGLLLGDLYDANPQRREGPSVSGERAQESHL